MSVLPLPFDVHGEVLRAHERLRGRVIETPVRRSHWLSAATGAEVWLKLENVQVTGSFKVRGATNKLLALSAVERARGVVAASSGNHGLAVAHAARSIGCTATVFVPETCPAAKRSAIAELGAEVHVFGPDCVDTEVHARQFAAARERPYISPYNDPLVAAGQGTIAVELLRQLPAVEVVYVALGGGGLIGGMAGYAATARPGVEFVGCSPAQSTAMEVCVRAGRIVAVPCGPTLSDSTAGGVEPGAITFELCRRLVHRYLQVDEPAIAAALRGCLEHEHQLVEGAAAVALAACLADAELRGRRACVLLCGGNLPLSTLQQLLGVPANS